MNPLSRNREPFKEMVRFVEKGNSASPQITELSNEA
jgi:hypothetical protein